ncbi:MAG: M28 family peptidase [Thermoanaerobaculia bacterium]|nr:M28 family peptidase [Thermoanaerobaculia bacterium]
MSRSRVAALLLSACLLPGLAVAEAPVAAPLLGFPPEAAAAQRAREAAFDAAIDAAEIGRWMEHLTSRPRHVGAPWTKESAEWMRDLLASWGWQARLETFEVLFPTPLERSLELTAPTYYRASLEEPALSADATSGQKKEQLPTYNAYSIDGDVEGELVYVNYGLPSDYEELARRGIDVRGRIVLARYGGSWRGIKPKVAAEMGAVGCVIFSDPAGDGYVHGDPYPDGGWRTREGVQRGSVADMPLYAGDPLTPGIPAVPGAERLSLQDTPTLTRIPVLPISAGDAEPLLRALGGPMAPESWRGALPLPYRLGAGPARVKLTVRFDWSLQPIYNVVATMLGAELPDEWIVRGNHHDAWVNGATDPVSGMAALLAEAKAIGQLAATGWRPRRTLVFAGWDAEEPGLLGSTEWAEAHAEALRAKAVAYVNTDSIGRGFLGLAGSHSLERFVNEVARDLTDPETGATLAERARAAAIVAAGPAERAEIRARTDLRIGALGSGSDFTPFLQFLGVASLNLDFGGQDQYGQYHSIYDSFDHYRRFMDPGFRYAATAARVAGRVALRLADAEVVPLTLERSAQVIADYAHEVKLLADRLRAESEERATLLDERALELAADPREAFVAPPRLDRVPFLEFARLHNAAVLLQASAEAFETARAAAEARGLAPARRDELNAFLRGFERRLTRDEGLPGRSWYKHQIYAPGLYTGYGVKTLPAIREAIELRQWDEANAQIVVVAGVLDAARAAIDSMTGKLAPAS